MAYYSSTVSDSEDDISRYPIRGDSGTIEIPEPRNKRGGTPEIREYTYVLGKHLGNGSYGHVHDVKLYENNAEVHTDKQYAMKMGTDKEAMQNEINLYKKLVRRQYSHCILGFYASKLDNGIYYILFEKYGISLQKHVKTFGALSTIETKIVVIHICWAIQHIHDNADTIIHDLKPGNVLVTGSGWNIRAKLCDFGSAYKKPTKSFSQTETNNDDTKDDKKQNKYCIPQTGYSSMTRNSNKQGPIKINDDQQHGTNAYKSPELYSTNHTNLVDEYDFSSDIWCVGCIVYYCIAGKHPSWGIYKSKYQLSPAQVVGSTHFRPRFPDNTTSNIIEFVLKLLQINPNNRPSINDILSNGRNFLNTFETYFARKQLFDMKYALIHDIKTFGKLLVWINKTGVQMKTEFDTMKDILTNYKNKRSQNRTPSFRKNMLFDALYHTENSTENIQHLANCYNWQKICNLSKDCSAEPNKPVRIRDSHLSTPQCINLDRVPCLLYCGNYIKIDKNNGKQVKIPWFCDEVENVTCGASNKKKEMVLYWLNNQSKGKVIIDGIEFTETLIFEEEKPQEKERMNVVNYKKNRKLNRLPCQNGKQHEFEENKFEYCQTVNQESKEMMFLCQKCSETDFVGNSIAYECKSCKSVVGLECKMTFFE